MLIQLVGGPLDGQRVECAEGETGLAFPKKSAAPVAPGVRQTVEQAKEGSDCYVQILPGVFMSLEVPQEDMINAVAQKVVDGYTLRHTVGMAVAQLDDAAMWVEDDRQEDAERSIAQAKDLLCTIS